MNDIKRLMDAIDCLNNYSGEDVKNHPGYNFATACINNQQHAILPQVIEIVKGDILQTIKELEAVK